MPTVEGDRELPRNEDETLSAFTRLQRFKLIMNRHKGGWKSTSADVLMGRVEEEMQEVYRARDVMRAAEVACKVDTVTDSQKAVLVYRRDEARKAFAKECADVANFLMMLADVSGGLEQ